MSYRLGTTETALYPIQLYSLANLILASVQIFQNNSQIQKMSKAFSDWFFIFRIQMWFVTQSVYFVFNLLRHIKGILVPLHGK